VSRQKLGQHFLVKSSVLDRIARAACPEREPVVIEIGPGKGPLTGRLLERAARVVAVEIDPALVEFLRSKYAGEPRLTVIHGDALGADLGQWGPAVIAGNLPYYAATPIIEKALALGEGLRHAVFLVQKEVAARLIAIPGRRDYGYLTLRTRLAADVEKLFDVPPSAFRPSPKVDSTLVRLRPRRRTAELGIHDTAGFLSFLALCFRQKRKTIRNNLAGAYGKEIIGRWPEAAMRAEQLTLEQFAELYGRLAASRP
jgi:16S rRNA (adenine1518-N6/adenine1519-N6)-dimethyltransferase